MSKSKVTTSSSHVTACPECDSANLVQTGSEIECISCGWTHKAKKPRTKEQAKKELAALVGADVVEVALAATRDPSIAAQLAAAVTAAPKAKAERKPRATSYTITAKGLGFSPDPERARVTKDKNRNTWLAVKALFADPEATVALAQIWEVAPAHKDFVGYAVRSGWLTVAK